MTGRREAREEGRTRAYRQHGAVLCRSIQCLCAVCVELSKLVLCCLQFGLQPLGVPGHVGAGEVLRVLPGRTRELPGKGKPNPNLLHEESSA